MICSKCGGSVEWVGPLGKLTHTKCQSCGAINSKIELEDDRGRWDRVGNIGEIEEELKG